MPRRLLTLGILVALLAGCGGGSDKEAAVKPAGDQDGQISEREQRERELKRRLAAKEQKEKAAAEAKTAQVGGDAAVNRMLARLPGRAGLVAGPPGGGAPDLSGGALDTGDAWSTIKVPIAERVLADAGGPNRLDAVRKDEINRAITLSDNDAAASLFQSLEQTHGGLDGASEAVGQMLRQAGDSETVISTEAYEGFSTYGQTNWSLPNQYRYMAALAGGCVGNAPTRSFLLGQMAAVGGSDNFGLGAAGFPAKWKGGWGPSDGGYLVRQMGVMDVNGKEIVMAMAAIPEDGSFESGRSMLSHVARWTAAHLAEQISRPAGC